MSIGAAELEIEEIDRLSALLDAAHARMRSLIELLAQLHIHAEHTPDGWLVVDERVEEALKIKA